MSRPISPICPECGRHTPLTMHGLFKKHRVEADNPIAKYCGMSGK